MFSLEKRWKEHCKDCHKIRTEKRPLYSAMQKYGIENFKMEEIEECADNVASEREVYWIERLQTFKNGYNATADGDGTHYLDYDLICETYSQVKNVTKTAEICNCCTDSVSNILKERHIDVISSQELAKQNLSKMINQYDLNGNYIQSFASVSDAARYIQSLDPVNRTGFKGIHSHISAVARGKRKTAYKYIWKFGGDKMEDEIL